LWHQKKHLLSRGLGAVQRKIAEVLAANPEDAFLVEELCSEVYKQWSLGNRGTACTGGDKYKEIIEGGEWWLRVQEWIARQNNDTARLAELLPMIAAEKQKAQAFMAMFLRG
jgi:hypothetical protein